jgi:hypothetical protein
MATRVHTSHTANLMRRLASSINRARAHALRKGKPIPWGTLTPPPANTVLGREPTPFTGGN